MRKLPDALTGAIMAVEGIEDAMVLLHGPGGCRIRHSIYSDVAFPRPEQDRGEIYHGYFAGFPRIPATYIDGNDYVNGAVERLEDALEAVRSADPGLIVIIDSPGASLMGDNHRRALADMGVMDGAMVLDEDLMSRPFPAGVDAALTGVMEELDPPSGERRRNTAVLLGLTVADVDWDFALDELSSYLGDMGIEVVCAPGAGSSLEEMRRSVDAEFAVTVRPETCARLSEYYAKRGLAAVDAPTPVGFDATESWIRAVAEATGRDPSGALARLSAVRSRVVRRMSGMPFGMLRVRGMTFSVRAPASTALPLVRWLVDWLSMAPRSVEMDDGSDPGDAEELRGYLGSIGFGDVLGSDADADILFADGVTCAIAERSHSCIRTVPLGGSPQGYDGFVPRTVFGATGAAYIADEVLRCSRSV